MHIVIINMHTHAHMYYITWHRYIKASMTGYYTADMLRKAAAVLDHARLSSAFRVRYSVNMRCVSVPVCVGAAEARLVPEYEGGARAGLAEIWLLLPRADPVSAPPWRHSPDALRQSDDRHRWLAGKGAGLCLSQSVFLECDLIAGFISYLYSSELWMCWRGSLFKEISLPRSRSADIKVNTVNTAIFWNIVTIQNCCLLFEYF